MTTYIVSSGQTTSGTVLNTGDAELVLSGGTASSSIVSKGGFELVSAGGVAIGTVISSGGEQNVFGGTVSSTTVQSGGVDFIGPGIASSTTVNSGGFVWVFSRGTTSGATIESGALEWVEPGGSAVAADVKPDGTLILSPGAEGTGTTSATGAHVLTSGVAVLSATAVTSAPSHILSGAVISGGGTMFGFSPGSMYEFVMPRGIAIGTTVENLGEQFVYGTAIRTLVTGFGGTEQYVYSGGVAIETTVASGGFQIVYSGGVAIGTRVSGGGVQVESGGTAISSGAVLLSGTTVISGPSPILGSVLVSSGESLYVLSGAAAISATVFGGSAGVLSGGTATNPVINGGVLDLMDGAIASGAISFTGGVGMLQIDAAIAADFPSATISGFTPSDQYQIDLSNIPFDPSEHADLGAGNTLNITENGTTYTLQLDQSQDFTGASFRVLDDGFGDTLVVCFCRGTRILTEHGEVAVEDLTVGDRVVTLSGAAKPIRWIGIGRDLVTRANRLARPIVVRQGALADDVPARDLYLTHGHALHFPDAGGVLVPVEHLVNHHSIAWDDTARVVEYFHIELDDHDVIFAEGAAAETYYDAGNRALFHNTAERSVPGPSKPLFAPVLHAGDIVGEIWARLMARAGGSIGGSAGETTDDPDPHLVITGRRIDPASTAAGVYAFRIAELPAGAVTLRSRSVVPSLAGDSRHEHRRLGIAIRQLIVQQPGILTALDCGAALLRQGGCYPPEDGYCWTDGELVLPPLLFAHLHGAFTLFVHTKRHALHYPLAADPAPALADSAG